MHINPGTAYDTTCDATLGITFHATEDNTSCNIIQDTTSNTT